MSTRLLIVIVTVLALFVALAATNPTTAAYGVFIETTFERALEHLQEPESRDRKIIQELLASQGKKMIPALIRSHTVRRNYGLFSLFETRLLQVDITIVGIAGRFIPLDDEEELKKKLGRLAL